jgi:hypothetical protein
VTVRRHNQNAPAPKAAFASATTRGQPTHHARSDTEAAPTTTPAVNSATTTRNPPDQRKEAPEDCGTASPWDVSDLAAEPFFIQSFCITPIRAFL